MLRRFVAKPNKFPYVLRDIFDAFVESVTTALNGKEPSLGNPDTDGKVLSSTAAGVRSWVESGGSSTSISNNGGTVEVEADGDVNISPAPGRNIFLPAGTALRDSTESGSSTLYFDFPRTVFRDKSNGYATAFSVVNGRVLVGGVTDDGSSGFQIADLMRLSGGNPVMQIRGSGINGLEIWPTDSDSKRWRLEQTRDAATGALTLTNLTDGVVAMVIDATGFITLPHQLVLHRASGSSPMQRYTLLSSTGTVRDASAIDTVWTDSTDATRTSAVVVSTVSNGGALTEAVRVYRRLLQWNGLASSDEVANAGFEWNYPGSWGLRLRPTADGNFALYNTTSGSEVEIWKVEHNGAQTMNRAQINETLTVGTSGASNPFRVRASRYTAGQSEAWAVATFANDGSDFTDRMTFTGGGAGDKALAKMNKTDIRFEQDDIGPILKDRTTGTNYRLYVDNGVLSVEAA